ncbi:tyrosine/nicotianamine aminotransferase, Pyridoxal phosphate-dependent transferase [Artemisia annua]|uniref:Tyrosine/nicotianamine aminotransferase, Pyridoxal phosphate-dependent transferase n=1 Tax=Artemisia annua TaxID=35608 RepID=A0A2U1KAX4_ARTAN|nr:tyrosine/nicotianamine aminotransferase, Pyridoxal phosphate-dependent transferase [Artemisia annua]
MVVATEPGLISGSQTTDVIISTSHSAACPNVPKFLLISLLSMTVELARQLSFYGESFEDEKDDMKCKPKTERVSSRTITSLLHLLQPSSDTYQQTMLLKSLLKFLGQTGANILFPTPNYLLYEAQSSLSPLEVCNFNLLPEKGWEVYFDGVKALEDNKFVAIVLISPGNPCGNVFTCEHMQKV